MKSLKIKLFFSLTIFALVTASIAQEVEKSKRTRPELTPEKKAEKQVDRLSSKLAFTEDQKKKVYEFTLQKSKQQELDKTNCGEDEKCLKEARRERMKKFQEQIKGVLSAEQIVKLEEMKKDRKGNRGALQQKKAMPEKPKLENELKE